MDCEPVQCHGGDLQGECGGMDNKRNSDISEQFGFKPNRWKIYVTSLEEASECNVHIAVKHLP